MQISSRPTRPTRWAIPGTILLLLIGGGEALAENGRDLRALPKAQAAEVPALSCPAEMILGTGPADAEILSAEASVGVRAFWCERYDAFGRAKRLGPYREVYANGQIRLEATYVKAGSGVRLEGPVEIRNEDGSPFLKGFLKQGEWDGPFEIFYDETPPARTTSPAPAAVTQTSPQAAPRAMSKTDQLDTIWPIGPTPPQNPLGPPQNVPNSGDKRSPSRDELSAAN